MRILSNISGLYLVSFTYYSIGWLGPTPPSRTTLRCRPGGGLRQPGDLHPAPGPRGRPRALHGWHPTEEDRVFQVRVLPRDGRQVLVRDQA